MIAPQRLQHVSSASLALLMHGLLLLALMIGVSWKIPPQLPIEADIWTELPALPPPPPEFAPPPEPLPAVEAKPEVEPIDQTKIALEKAEKKRAAEALLAKENEAALQQKAEKKRADDQRIEAARQAEQARIERERVEKVQAEKREQTRHQLDQELARQLREELDAESTQLKALQGRAKVSSQARLVQDFRERIRAKIRDGLVLPQNLKGDAEVTFQVTLLPNGEVVRVTLVKTSGQPLYDGAVERAIYKASPLPLPSDREAAQPFRDGLTLKFRPSDEAAAPL